MKSIDVTALPWTQVTRIPPSRGEASETMSSTETCDRTTLARAAEATAKLQREIDQLWNDSITADDDVSSERLVAVSHAIHRVAHLLDARHVIG
jgi:hypothetical protein